MRSIQALFIAGIVCLHPAHADDACEAAAAQIADQMNLEAAERTDAGFIGLSPLDGDYGAYLNCEGPFGMSLRFVKRWPVSPDWLEFVARTSSILNRRAPDDIARAVSDCIASSSGSVPADGPRMICDHDTRGVEVIIPQR